MSPVEETTESTPASEVAPQSKHVAKWRRRPVAKSRESIAALRETVSELMFMLLPFVVLILVYGYCNQGTKMLGHPELSIASTLFFGQAIVKFMCGVSQFEHRGLAAMVATLGIVLGLAPSLTVLVLIELAEQRYQEPGLWLLWIQGFLFLAGGVFFLMFRWLGALGAALLLENQTLQRNEH